MTHISPDNFWTASLRANPWGKRITNVLTAALNAVDPYVVLKSNLNREGSRFVIADRAYDLDEVQRLFLIGVGKASVPMAQAANQILGDYISAGVIITKEGQIGDAETNLPKKIVVVKAGHPIPNERGIKATQLAIELLKNTSPDDLVLCLISGGGSALLTAPVSGISLEDLQTVTSKLLASGAHIHEINALRKHLSQVKGGRLAQMATPATVLTLILSDVVGDPLDVIASGPTVPDTSTFIQALQILEKYDLLDKVPVAIVRYLQRGVSGEVPETPKPDHPAFHNTQNLIIANNHTAAQAAKERAEKAGFNSLLLTTYLQGEARQAGVFLAALARQIAFTDQPIPRPACVIAGGETTVTLVGDGLGGRNQEVALSAVHELADLQGVALITLATDGDDGPTKAAGAVVTGETFSRAMEKGLNPIEFLNRNDSYNFFDPLGDIIKTGPTQTNVNDLAFIFAH